MATTKTKKPAAMPPAEQKITDQIAALKATVKKQKDEKATDAQKEQLKAWRQQLGQLRFLRLVNKRLPKVLHAILNLSNFSGAGYAYTPEQAAKVVKALKDSVSKVEAALLAEGGSTETPAIE